MRAAAIDRFGGCEVLSIHLLPVPVPDAREVLIAVDTAGVGGWDAEMRGVGSLAVQFAKLRGARVLPTATGEDGLALAQHLGAERAVDGRHEDIMAAARRFAPHGIDAVLALVGGKWLTRSLDALRRGGRLAYPNGIEPEPIRNSVISTTLRSGWPGESCQSSVIRSPEG